MNNAVIVAHAGTLWASRAKAALVDARWHVAWISSLGLVTFFLGRPIRAILVDAALVGPTWVQQRARFEAGASGSRIMLIHEPGEPAVAGSVAWPADPAAALLLLNDDRS
jgi:hypothetical protein